MEETLFLVLVTCIVLMVSWWAWKAFNLIWWKPMKLQRCLMEQGIRGPPYRFLYGNLKENFGATMEAKSKPMDRSHDIMPRVLPFVHQTVEQYGKISVIWYGPTPRVQITDPDLIKDVLSNKHGDFPKTKSSPLRLLVAGLVSYEGEKWVKHRRIINPAFQQEKLKMMVPAFYASCSEMVRKWQKLIPEESMELDVWPEFQNLTGDVISRAAFGSSYEEGQRIFQLQTEQAELLIQAAQSSHIPGFRYLPTKSSRRSKEIEKEVKTLLRGIIHKREKALKLDKAKNDDLLGFLMESNLKEIENNDNSKNVGMSIEEVIDECKLFYFAGQETASTLLVWTMIVLSMHPEWQEQAREEILQVFGKRKPDFDGLNHLKIVMMILYEVLRLYPPVVMLIRAHEKTTKLGDLSLPPGVHVTMPILIIHRNPELWGEDAEKFNPGRFSEGVSKATKNRVTFFPFGWGPRICIGQNFALIETKMALAMILQSFSFELSTTYVHAPCTVVTLQPQHGAQLILHKL